MVVVCFLYQSVSVRKKAHHKREERNTSCAEQHPKRCDGVCVSREYSDEFLLIRHTASCISFGLLFTREIQETV
ncbi:MAG TPA: hypothetical protein DCE42_10910 [Myxococcales bacterium]|nr:hypothetical protein [Deltaproteobacteria bacterium]MBU54560.1 hypothetical protein [Deltaproteobacteria bacterium]HAA55257.1 hypothetical protein [Myxococcales bacterium]